jgi:GTP-binding nuclear protein Ran
MKDIFKICILGDGGTGKTTWLTKLTTGQINNRYIATLGVSVSEVNLDNENNLSIWDTAGQERFRGLGDGYYINSNYCIIFCDLSSKISRKNIFNWRRDFLRVNNNGHIFVVLCKSDLTKRKYSSFRSKLDEYNIPYMFYSNLTDDPNVVLYDYCKLYSNGQL